jgi:hypothetical protein
MTQKLWISENGQISTFVSIIRNSIANHSSDGEVDNYCDGRLLVINDPRGNVSDLLAEARNKEVQHARTYLYRERIRIDDDRIATEFQQHQEEGTSSSSLSFGKLEIVSCQGSRIPNQIETALSEKNVKCFALRKITFRLEDCIQAFPLSGNSYVQDLTLEISLSEKFCRHLADFLRSSYCTLHQLRLEQCSFQNRIAVTTFSNGLKHNTTLSSLAFINCHLQDDDFEILFPSHANLPKSIRYLNVMDNYCRSYILRRINNSNIRYLNLTNQHPGEFGGSLDVQLLSHILLSNTTL